MPALVCGYSLGLSVNQSATQHKHLVSQPFEQGIRPENTIGSLRILFDSSFLPSFQFVYVMFAAVLPQEASHWHLLL